MSGAGVGAGAAAADASTDADDLGAEKHVEGAEVDEDDTDEEDPAEAAQDTIASLKKLVGIEEQVNPKDGAWFQLTRTEFRTGNMRVEKMGRFLVSIECMPVALAEKIPAGFGRSEPNSNPALPAPTGRLKFTLNPFAMLSQFLGAGIVFKLCCCILFLGIIIASIFLAPFLGVVIPALEEIPHPFGLLIGLAIIVVVLGPCIGVYCRRRAAVLKAKAASLARRRDKGLPPPVSKDYKPVLPGAKASSTPTASGVSRRNVGGSKGGQSDPLKAPLLGSN